MPSSKRVKAPKKTSSGLKEVKTFWKYPLSEVLRAVRDDPSVSPIRKEDAQKILVQIEADPRKNFYDRLKAFPKELPRAFGMHAPFYGEDGPSQGVSALDVEARGCSLAERYCVRRVDVSRRA